MRFLAAALILLHSSTALPAEKTVRLSVMSYNIKGLPSLLTSSEWKNPRYALMGKQIAASAASIVLLQEAFSENTKHLLKAADYPHIAQGPALKTFVGLDSGLYILSKFPILAKAQREFTSSHCARLDCFANKGMQFARIAVAGLNLPLEVFNTHLQAGRDDPPARARQVKMLVDFYKEHHIPGSPVIFGGDFNLRPLRNSGPFEEFVRGTGLGHSGKYCMEKGCARSPDSGWQGIWENAVDHQFYSSEGSVRITPVSIERKFGEPVEGYRLSDHLAHEATFELHQTGIPAPGKTGF